MDKITGLFPDEVETMQERRRLMAPSRTRAARRDRRRNLQQVFLLPILLTRWIRSGIDAPPDRDQAALPEEPPNLF
ncbi:MAG TPA: hypothetical protein VHY58_06085 [Streptosporangiaceae bacterium]|nr:hypothetical protein [Streptosporangiaceae bacterium]